MKLLPGLFRFLPAVFIALFLWSTQLGPANWKLALAAALCAPFSHVLARRLGILAAPASLFAWFLEIFWQSTLFLPLFLFLGISIALWQLPELHKTSHFIFVWGEILYFLFFCFYAAVVYFMIRTPLAAGATPPEASARTALFRFFQVLPYRLALMQIAGVLSMMALFLVGGIYLFLAPSALLLWLGTLVFIFFLASHLVQVPYLQSVLAPAMRSLIETRDLDFGKLRSPVGLRMKLRLWFGMLVFLSVSISAMWSLIQQYQGSVEIARHMARQRVQAVLGAHQERMAANPQGDPAALMKSIVEESARAGGGWYYWAPKEGRPLPAGRENLPRLPVEIRSRIRTASEGVLSWHERGLQGYFSQVSTDRTPLGTLVIFLPQENAWTQVNARSRLVHLAVFFLMVFLLTFAGVNHFVRDTVAPLAELEYRFNAIAAGRLQEPILPPGEMDELGRLCVAFEHMRRTIADKIATIEELNAGLEQKVLERTQDLEQANRQLKAALEDLRMAQDRLVEAGKLAAMGRLLAGIAHEINNPVNAVSNALPPFVELLSRLQADPGGAQGVVPDLAALARIVERGTRRIQQIVERITAARAVKDEPLVPVVLLGAVSNTLELLREPLSGVDVQVDMAPDLAVLALETPLEQVFTNLFVNAAHAMRESPVRRLEVSAHAAGTGRIVVKVRDTGAGMPDSVREKIFDPFFTTKDVGEGMGLGLSIVRDIVLRCGGEIEVHSREGEGTCFTLVFWPALLPEKGAS